MNAELRVATPKDAEPLAELLNAIAIAEYGEPELAVDELRPFLSNPLLEFVVAERDGAIVGCGDRRREEARDRGWFDVRVHAGDAATADALRVELERRAFPELDTGARLMTFVASVDETVRRVFEAAGYERIRASFEMAISLDSEPETAFPEGVVVTPYDPKREEAAVHAAHQEAFRDHWEHRDRSIEEWRGWMVETPSFDPSLWFVAREGDQIAGVSLCRVHWSGDPEHGYVSVLAVRRPWRRRGLGTSLLQHSFAEMKRRGMTRASLGVDAENLTGAVGLYERAGMHVERRYDCYQKLL